MLSDVRRPNAGKVLDLDIDKTLELNNTIRDTILIHDLLFLPISTIESGVS